MKHLKKLISETVRDSKARWAIREDLAGMYFQDSQDFRSILKMINDKNYSGAKKLIQYMDTLPRESAIMAIAYDLGVDWVAKNLKYEVTI
tara:strand:- start:283 stop:552 length:270 start_codon:yes stop_codon:yes gene_type:complete